jgi:hypothetical protein
MENSTLAIWQEYSEDGIVYELGSLFEGLQQLSDLRQARGKRNSLITLLVIILLAKLCGQNTPVEIVDWAKNQTETHLDAAPQHHSARVPKRPG